MDEVWCRPLARWNIFSGTFTSLGKKLLRLHAGDTDVADDVFNVDEDADCEQSEHYVHGDLEGFHRILLISIHVNDHPESVWTLYGGILKSERFKP